MYRCVGWETGPNHYCLLTVQGGDTVLIVCGPSDEEEGENAEMDCMGCMALVRRVQAGGL